MIRFRVRLGVGNQVYSKVRLGYELGLVKIHIDDHNLHRQNWFSLTDRIYWPVGSALLSVETQTID